MNGGNWGSEKHIGKLIQRNKDSEKRIKELEDTLEKIKQDIYEPDKILIHLERKKAREDKDG